MFEKTGGFFTRTITEFSDKDLEIAGTMRPVGHRVFIWAKNGTTADRAAGDAVFWGAVNPQDSLKTIFYTLNQAAMQTAANMFAGVLVSAVPNNNYGWVQCYGETLSTGLKFDATVAIVQFDNLVGVNGQVHMIKGQAVGTAPIHRSGAIALEAKAAGNGTLRAFISALQH